MRPALWISLCLAATGLSASSQTVPTINACVNNLNGATRVVASSTNCISGVETFKQWNITGPQGPQGLAGPQGPAGAQGPQGLIGSPGQRGAVGAPGPMGNIGPQGPVGDTGAQGPVGQIGPQGPRGEIGLAGHDGAPGENGSTGPSGPTGPAGPAGGKVYEANLAVPSSIPNSVVIINNFWGSVSGMDTLAAASFNEPSDPVLQAHELIIPTACVVHNFSVTQVGAAGADLGQISLAAPTDPTGSSSFLPLHITCVLRGTGTTGAGAMSSCSSTETAALPAGTAIALAATLPSDWSNAHLLVSFTCD